MFWINNATFIKVWKVESKEKYTDLFFSTSEKTEKNGETIYINSDWNGRCVGKAHNQAVKMQKGDSAKILKGKITREKYKDKEGNWKLADPRVLILEFESSDKTEKSDVKKNEEAGTEEIIEDSDLPF